MNTLPDQHGSSKAMLVRGVTQALALGEFDWSTILMLLAIPFAKDIGYRKRIQGQYPSRRGWHSDLPLV